MNTYLAKSRGKGEEYQLLISYFPNSMQLGLCFPGELPPSCCI